MLLICLPCHVSSGQEEPAESAVELVPADKRACFFADDKVALLYSAPVGPWHVDWSLMVGNRTVRKGSSQARLPADGQQYLVEISTPPLRPGIVLPVNLQMTWISGNRNNQQSRPLTIFSRDPFTTRHALLEQAQIKLFDADGQTAELLENYEIPHTRLINLSAIDLVTEGLVLVGEGVSFREQSRLPQALLRASQRGVSVLCLAPSEGEFPLQDGQQARPHRLALQRGDVVRGFDKRFDEISTVSPLSLVPRRNEVLLSANNAAGDWSWLTLEFSPKSPDSPRGKLILCGLGIISHWDAGPVPRYLFVRLLEELSQTQSTEERQENELTEN